MITAQVLASLASGMALAAAAILMNEPFALLLLAICCIFAYASHDPNLPLAIRVGFHYVGLLLGLAIFGYLALQLT